MLPTIVDAAPAVLGVFLVLGGFLSNLAVAAGLPSAPVAAAQSNHSDSRYTYDGLHRRSFVENERHPVSPAQLSDSFINRRQRADTALPSRADSRPDCRFGDCGGRPVGVLDVPDDGPEGPVLPVTVLQSRELGTRMRPATKALKPVVPKRKTKKDDDDDDDDYDDDDDDDDKAGKLGGPAKTFKIKKHKLKKWLLPLLVGYKLKFMTLVPLLFATLALLVASAGFAGFFFAMFTAALTLPKAGGHH